MNKSEVCAISGETDRFAANSAVFTDTKDKTNVKVKLIIYFN